MTVTERISGAEWAQVGTIAMPGETPEVPAIYRLAPSEELRKHAAAVNMSIRTDALVTQNIGKGFHQYVTHFDHQEAVAATVAVEPGWKGEHEWSVFFQQGRHRMGRNGMVWFQRDLKEYRSTND
jgi:hypothetical protein